MTSAIKRIDEYGQPTGKLEPSKHLKNRHKFDWIILLGDPWHCLKQKILEAYFIAQLNSSLNVEFGNEIFTLFRHEVT